jgi:hypothetical protein
MKAIHFLLGTAWIGIMVCFRLGLRWAWKGMLACAVLSLWYLPFGTLLSSIQIVLLLLPALRAPQA